MSDTTAAGCGSSEEVSSQLPPPEKKLKTNSDPISSYSSSSLDVKKTDLDDNIDDAYDTDSDSDEFCKEYFEQLEASGGFDIDVLPKSYPKYTPFGYILPHGDLKGYSVNREIVDKLSEFAIAHYNDKNNTNYKYAKLVKVNTQVSGGVIYFITLEAEDDNDDGQGQPKTFQAKVWRGVEENEVMLCRLKNTN